MYEYRWVPGGLAPMDLVEEMAELYSAHYGIWGTNARYPGRKIRLSPQRIKDFWLSSRDSRIVWARFMGRLVGYAIAVQTRLPRFGVVSWVTQLVVHEDYRRTNVGKTLLFTIWQFTDHFAWGLLTANPYAVRALEKATRRRCAPSHIEKHQDIMTRLGTQVVPYADPTRKVILNASESRIDTGFYLDHSALPQMLRNATDDEKKPWCLGPLLEGWEWFAFTFRDQQQIALSRQEIEQMLLASDAVTKEAYSRMQLKAGEQPWTKFAPAEVEFIRQHCFLTRGKSVLDLGFGRGRHAIGLAQLGIDVLGLDYVEPFISVARQEAQTLGLNNAAFRIVDCADAELQERFDAVLCLYDVIGSYADENKNTSLVKNVSRHLKPGGYALLSVMNMELTEHRARNWFAIDADPDKLLALAPSSNMEKTGEVFNPEHYLIDRNTKIVYRKEQFHEGDELPVELVVRDRRYTHRQIEDLCVQAGLEVVWSRFVRAGRWREELSPHDDHAKEILVLCRKPEMAHPTLF